MILITWIIISLGFFVDTAVPQGKEKLECYECTHDETCADTHEPGQVMKCGKAFEELFEKVQNNTNGNYDDQIKEFFEQFGGGGGFNPFSPNGGSGGGFNPFNPGGGGNIDWSKNPFFQRSSTDNSTDGTVEESDAASRQFNNLPQLTWYCGRMEEGGKVIRFCQNEQPGITVGNTCPPNIPKGIKCSFCNTDKCNGKDGNGKGGNGKGGNGKDGNGNDDNGSTQLGQMSIWRVIILSAFLTSFPLHFYN